MSSKANKQSKQKISFAEAVKSVIVDVNERAKDILAKRFGFGRKKGMTLSQIGDEYGITRERVRQIIQESVNKAKKRAEKDKLFREAEGAVKFTVESEYGIIPRDDLKEKVLDEKSEHNFVDFIVHCSEELEIIESDKKVEDAVALADFDFSEWERLHNVAEKVLADKAEALELEHFFDHFGRHLEDFDKEKFEKYLQVSRNIKKSVFGKWGLAHWSEINPKSTRQKAYLVIKESGKPLHFREVADLIYKFGLSPKEAHPQTVHNELIKDDRFVLVGRGTYALSEWGYQRGTVKDVIENILKDKQNPVHQDEIVREVLSVRNVKEATVIINLNNFFEKKDAGRYMLKRGVK